MSFRHAAEPEPVPPEPGSFSRCLDRLNADYLKRAARFWARNLPKRMARDDALQAVESALADDAWLRELPGQRGKFERAALWLLRLDGGLVPAITLAGELLAYGVSWSSSRSYGHEANPYDPINSLIWSGVVLRLPDPSRYYTIDFSSSYYEDSSERRVFTDTRVLPYASPVPPATLEVAPLDGAYRGSARRPAEVGLRFVSMIEAIRKQGSIALTTRGRPAKPFLNRLTKALGWDAPLAAEAHTPLPEATPFFFGLLQAVGMIEHQPVRRR